MWRAGCVCKDCMKMTVFSLRSSGLLHDYFGNYTVAFSLAGVPPMVGGVVLFFVPLIHRRLQRGLAPASEEATPTSHMLPSAEAVEEPKSCSNGNVLPGYTDVETHIWVAPHRGDTCIDGRKWRHIFLHLSFCVFLGIQPASSFSPQIAGPPSDVVQMLYILGLGLTYNLSPLWLFG